MQLEKKRIKNFFLNNNNKLKNTKYIFLNNIENLTKKQLSIVKDDTLKTSAVYLLKEEFKKVYDLKTKNEIEKFIKVWCDKALALNNHHLQKFVNLILNHLKGIIDSIILKANNAIAEGFNSVIELIKYSARGISSFKNFRIRILFFCRYQPT